MSELTEAEAEGLDQIKARMSQSQRAEMAEVIRKEMERRGMIEGSTASRKSNVRAAAINGGLNSDQVKELYQDVGQAMQELKVRKLEENLAKIKGKTAPKKSYALPKLNLRREVEQDDYEAPVPSRRRRLSMQSALFYSVCGLAACKVVLILGIFDSTIATAKPASELDRIAAQISNSSRITQAVAPMEAAAGIKLWSPAEKEILTQLDSRRVELERRKEALDRREQELENQAQALTERLAELRGLTSKMQELRKEREHKQEGRLAQLANVYGAMEPVEASGLLARLDDTIALELLERMPEKRMGQILSFMEKGRAVDLTKLLTEKKVVE